MRGTTGRVRLLASMPPCQLALSLALVGMSAEALLAEADYQDGSLSASDWQLLLVPNKDYPLQVEATAGDGEEAAMVRATLVASEWRAHKAELRFVVKQYDEAYERLLGAFAEARDERAGAARRKHDLRFL